MYTNRWISFEELVLHGCRKWTWRLWYAPNCHVVGVELQLLYFYTLLYHNRNLDLEHLLITWHENLLWLVNFILPTFLLAFFPTLLLDFFVALLLAFLPMLLLGDFLLWMFLPTCLLLKMCGLPPSLCMKSTPWSFVAMEVWHDGMLLWSSFITKTMNCASLWT